MEYRGLSAAVWTASPVRRPAYPTCLRPVATATSTRRDRPHRVIRLVWVWLPVSSSSVRPDGNLMAYSPRTRARRAIRVTATATPRAHAVAVVRVDRSFRRPMTSRYFEYPSRDVRSGSAAKFFIFSLIKAARQSHDCSCESNDPKLSFNHVTSKRPLPCRKLSWYQAVLHCSNRGRNILSELQVQYILSRFSHRDIVIKCLIGCHKCNTIEVTDLDSTSEGNVYGSIRGNTLTAWKRKVFARSRQDFPKPLLKTTSCCLSEGNPMLDLARINMRFVIDVNINLTW